jgi:hypothetical protein
MNSKKRLGIACAIVLACVLSPCLAQTPIQLSTFAIFLDKNIPELDRIYINLLQMSNEQEDPYLAGSTGCVNDVSSAINLMHSHVMIYSLMRDKQDREIVTKFFKISSNRVFRTNEICIALLNNNFPKIKNDASMIELRQARDLIQKLQVEVKSISMSH